MNLGKLISQLHEQTGSVSRLHESAEWTEKWKQEGDSHFANHNNKSLAGTARLIGLAMADAREAIERGYFLTAAAQKEVSSDIGNAMERLGDIIEMGHSAKFNYMNTPTGLSEKTTKTFVDIARRVHGSKIDHELDLMTEMTKLRLQVKAIPVDKDKKPPSKTAVKAADRDGTTMTCQVCGGKYLAKKGKIAHHGYKRPGTGWQTASCFGAMALPFEVSRDTLGEWIEILEKRLVRAENELKFAKESPELTLTGKSDYYSKSAIKKEVKVTAENFKEKHSELTAQLNALKKQYDNPSLNARTFDDLRRMLVYMAESDLRGIKEYLEFSKKRYDNWKPQEKVA